MSKKIENKGFRSEDFDWLQNTTNYIDAFLWKDEPGGRKAKFVSIENL